MGSAEYKPRVVRGNASGFQFDFNSEPFQLGSSFSLSPLILIFFPSTPSLQTDLNHHSRAETVPFLSLSLSFLLPVSFLSFFLFFKRLTFTDLSCFCFVFVFSVIFFFFVFIREFVEFSQLR